MKRKHTRVICFSLVLFLFLPTMAGSVTGRNVPATFNHDTPEPSIDLRYFSNDDLFGLEDLFWNEGFNGTNDTIAILDTGIMNTHEVFAGKNITWIDVSSENESTYMDLTGHGTMCASLAAGSSSHMNGSAPGADIAAIKMFYDDGGAANAENEDVTAAVDFVLDNASSLNITVASCSWGDDNNSADGNDELSKIVTRLVDGGIITVVAAGNQEVGLNQVASPGTAPAVITVGSLNAYTFEVASHSLTGPTVDNRKKPDVIAPGYNVYGAAMTGSYRYGSGTSYATPTVAGIVALVHQRFPSLDHFSIKHLMCMTALESEYTGGNQDNREGWGVVNPAGIIQAMENNWNSSETGSISFNLSASTPRYRSYCTKIQVEPG
ncbi:MAG: S8 family serine peptidase, partial [Promethearchaeota archaeon]